MTSDFDFHSLDDFADTPVEETFLEHLYKVLAKGSDAERNQVFEQVCSSLSSDITSESKLKLFSDCIDVSPDFAHECFREIPPNMDFYIGIIRNKSTQFLPYLDYAVQHILSSNMIDTIALQLFDLVKRDRKYFVQLFNINNRFIRDDLVNLVYDELLTDYNAKVERLSKTTKLNLINGFTTCIGAASNMTRAQRPNIFSLTPAVDKLGLEEFDVSRLLENELLNQQEYSLEVVDKIRFQVFQKVFENTVLPERIRVAAAQYVLVLDEYRVDAKTFLKEHIEKIGLSLSTQSDIINMCKLILTYGKDEYFEQKLKAAKDHVEVPPRFPTELKTKLQRFLVPLKYNKSEIIYYQSRLLNNNKKDFDPALLSNKYSDLTPYIWNFVFHCKFSKAPKISVETKTPDETINLLENYFIENFASINIDEELLDVLNGQN